MGDQRPILRVSGNQADAASAFPTRAAKTSRLYAVAKRVFDVAFATTILIATAPLIAAAAIVIKLDSPGPVFFRQLRLGRGGRPFYLVKLRGMYIDAKDRHPALYDYTAITPETCSGLYFHQRSDPRVTRVGRLLRRYSIDELPNFWNVLRGEMSVVGPRPEIPELAHLYGEKLPWFLSVKPGVTSPAKARGRDELSFDETLSLELVYVETMSFSLDLRTIWWTARSVVRGHGVKS